MRKMILVSVLLVFPLVCFGQDAALQDKFSLPGYPLLPPGSLQVIIGSDKEIYEVGEKVIISLEVKNVSNSIVTLPKASSSSFSFVNQFGEQFSPPKATNCEDPVSLEPGQSYGKGVRWAVFDLSEFKNYKVIGMHAIGITFEGQSSDIITIEVVEKKDSSAPITSEQGYKDTVFKPQRYLKCNDNKTLLIDKVEGKKLFNVRIVYTDNPRHIIAFAPEGEYLYHPKLNILKLKLSNGIFRSPEVNYDIPVAQQTNSVVYGFRSYYCNLKPIIDDDAIPLEE